MMPRPALPRSGPGELASGRPSSLGENGSDVFESAPAEQGFVARGRPRARQRTTRGPRPQTPAVRASSTGSTTSNGSLPSRTAQEDSDDDEPPPSVAAERPSSLAAGVVADSTSRGYALAVFGSLKPWWAARFDMAAFPVIDH